MTRPTDASIAREFWAQYDCGADSIDPDLLAQKAAKRDAESPAGPTPYIACAGCGADSPEKRCVGCMHIFGRKVTTSPERVQIPAESKRVCTVSTCRAEMRPGLHCGGPNCPLRPA